MEAITNKKAYFDYEILETFEAGIKLLGFEVKSVKLGRISLNGAYAKIYNGEVWLVNASISPFQEKNIFKEYDHQRPRVLLMHKKEISHLLGKIQEKSLTLVPLKIYNKKGKIKVELGLARSKKEFDKRNTIKKRETEREIRRKMKE